MTKEIIAEAKQAVKGNWWRIVGTVALMVVVVLLSALLNFIPVLGTIAYVLVAMYVAVGFTYYCFNVSKGHGKATEIFYPMQDADLRMAVLKLTGIVLLFALGFGIVMGVLAIIPVIGPILALILYVWMFMFVIYYSVVSFILFENPKMKVMDALKMSKEMTTGHRWTWFWMQFAVYLKPFLFLICGLILTVIIGFLSGGSSAFVGGGIVLTLTTIINTIHSIWVVILMPTVSMLTPVYYNKVKALSSKSPSSAEEINVTPY